MLGINTSIAGKSKTVKANSSFHELSVASAIDFSHSTSPVATFSATTAFALACATFACPSALTFSTLLCIHEPARLAIGPINAPNIIYAPYVRDPSIYQRHLSLHP